MNNFKELERMEMEELDRSVSRIKSDVNHNLGVFQFFGSMAELFLPRVLDIFVNILGRETRPERFPKDRYPNTGG